MDKSALVGSRLCPGKTDNESGNIFYGMFLAPKLKFCSSIKECGILDYHKTVEGFNKNKRLLNRYQFFKMKEGKKFSASLPKYFQKSFDSGVFKPAKMRLCNESIDKK